MCRPSVERERDGLFSRREFIGIIGAAGGGAILAACAPASPAGAPSPAATTARPAAAASPTAAATAAPTAAPSPAAAALLADVTWYKQSAFRWKAAKVVYVDPWGLTGDLPQADLVLVTHVHGDHFSKDDIGKISGSKTVFVAPADVAAALSGEVKVVKPGDRIEAAGVKIEATPAYNIVEARLNAHPKARNWVGYVIDLGGRVYYHAGDTDNLPELATVKTDAAFVPIGGTFTMDVKEAGALVKAMKPKVAVPMHYGFVPRVGTAADGGRFRTEAGPVEVQVLTPLVPFANR